MCERELETEQNCNILIPTLLAITAFLSRSPGLLNRRPGGPASLGAGFLYRILSPTRLIPNWLNFLCTELYNSSTSTFFLWASQIAFIQPVHGQGYNILIFLDWMHLLFTQVHFLFWQLSRVVSQYATFGTIPKSLVNWLEELKIGGRADTIQITALLRLACILRSLPVTQTPAKDHQLAFKCHPHKERKNKFNWLVFENKNAWYLMIKPTHINTDV